MKFVIIILVSLISTALYGQSNVNEIEPLIKNVDFLKQNHLSAKDYILKQFEKYDIVILCERYHMEETQYELIDSVINSDYFLRNVGNICVETGCSNFSSDLNEFMSTYDGPLEKGVLELIHFQQEISFYPVWQRNAYHIFLKKLLKTNLNLKATEKVNLYLCDREFDWKDVETYNDWKNANSNNRDSIMALNISKHFENIKNTKRHKMLCILNEAHAITNTEWIDMWQKRCGQYLADKYGRSKIATIFIHNVGMDDEENDILLKNGYWDAAFEITNTKSTGFDFKNSPFGSESFDYSVGKNNALFKYEDIFNGYVFYKPIQEHRLTEGVNGIITNDFRNEFLRRAKIWYPEEYYNELVADTVLSGWNSVEKIDYTDQDKMLSKIKSLQKKYFEYKE